MERQPSTPRQLARLTEELDEIGLRWDGREPWHPLAVAALDYARRPAVFERKAPSFGAIVAPTTDAACWSAETNIAIELRPFQSSRWMTMAGLFADGLSTWVLLNADGQHRAAVFDRPAGSERDLVVLAEAFGSTVIQRHPSGIVRVVGPAGVHRWDGIEWQHQPPLASWIDAIVGTCAGPSVGPALERLMEFALHDLGARNIGATLVHRPDLTLGAGVERRLPPPPRLRIDHPPDLAPLRHGLGQVDGASLFDEEGALIEIGVRLVPSAAAEADVPGFRGMRHTAGRRYSYDDPGATVIIVSESGTVTVVRAGRIVGVSEPPDDDADTD